MKIPLILSPLDSEHEVAELAKLGAKEFYCGIIPEEWEIKYSPSSIDRRPKGKAHFPTWESLQKAVSIAHDNGAKINLTINEHYYSLEQYPIIESFIENALTAKVDALIISDPALLLFIAEKNFPIETHLSTGGVCLNINTALFFKDLGVKRIILPRHLNIDEIKKITSASTGVEFETFIFNSRCVNVDGLCTFQHGLSGKKVEYFYKNACMLPFNVQAFTKREVEPDKKQNAIKKQRIWERVHIDDLPCGACSIYDFSELGIKALKIVGRGNESERKKNDVKFLSTLLSMLSNETDKKTFRIEAKKLYNKTYDRECRYHMCYYPEVMES